MKGSVVGLWTTVSPASGTVGGEQHAYNKYLLDEFIHRVFAYL